MITSLKTLARSIKINQVFQQHYGCLWQWLTDEGSCSVAKTFDLFLMDLDSVFSEVISSLSTNVGLPLWQPCWAISENTILHHHSWPTVFGSYQATTCSWLVRDFWTAVGVNLDEASYHCHVQLITYSLMSKPQASSWQRPSGQNIQLLSIINSCVLLIKDFDICWTPLWASTTSFSLQINCTVEHDHKSTPWPHSCLTSGWSLRPATSTWKSHGCSAAVHADVWLGHDHETHQQPWEKSRPKGCLRNSRKGKWTHIVEQREETIEGWNGWDMEILVSCSLAR